jgi:hypothetical protein
MPKYLLSAHRVEGQVREQMTAEEMQQSYKQIRILEEEMKSAGAWVFGGRLHNPDTCILYTTPSPRDRTRSRMR